MGKSCKRKTMNGTEKVFENKSEIFKCKYFYFKIFKYKWTRTCINANAFDHMLTVICGN